MKLNCEQQRAVDSKANRILCLAGAGAGKTQTMISRIVHLVESGVAPESILALTFTNAAAFEMKERFQKLSNSTNCPEFRTFHSFCYSLLASDMSVRMGLGYTQVPMIADTAALKQIEKTCLTKLGIKQTYQALSRSTSPKDQDTLKVYNKAFYQEMKARNLVTFDRLCYGVCEMFKENKPYIQRYKKQYQYIFVDEFQDTDPRQWEFVSSFTESSLFIVADALQAIYAFRGADSSIVKELSTDPDWEVIRLTKNYRSTKAICEYANGNSKYADDNYRIVLCPTRGKGQPVDIVPKTTKGSHIDPRAFSDIIDDWKARKSGTGAILCRTNSEVSDVCDLLKDKGVAYTSSRTVEEAQHILQSLNDDEHALEWLLTFLTAEKYAEWFRVDSLVEDADASAKLSRLLSDYKSVYSIRSRWAKITTARSIVSDEENVDVMTEKLSKLLNVDLQCSSKDKGEAIQELREQLAEAQSSSLYVGTIHSSKGLEYDAVYLMNVGSSSFKLDEESEKNLFYVGITRARDRLVVVLQV